MPPHPFESARDATLAALARHAAADPRIEALWLQGSRATGARDAAALRSAHLRIGDALVDAGRGACARLAVPYPIEPASEQAVRDLVEVGWPSP